MMDARERLAAAVRKAVIDASSRDMQWGVDDCALFFANIIRDALGYDPAADLRGAYCTHDGAARVLGRMGLGFYGRRIIRTFGWRRIESHEALPGDVGFMRLPVLQADRRFTVMVCRMPGWFCGRSAHGVVTVHHTSVRLVSAVV